MEKTIKAENPKGLVVERHTWLERVTHLVHVLAMFVLLITGLKIHFGWEFLMFHTARALHLIVVPFFLAANWILVPYNIFFAEGVKRSPEAMLSHFFEAYVFGPEDAKRLKGIILNFFGRGKYPAFTVYDAGTGHYKTKLHPALKLLILFESIAIVLIAFSGFVLYRPDWELFSLPVAAWTLSVAGFFSHALHMPDLGVIRYVHQLATYWFLFELTVHVGILEFDPKVWKYHKAIFWSGKEDLSDKNYVEVLGKK